MEILKAIEDRRSIRSYKKEEITREVIEDILNCGRLAPSAKNRQPWFFVVVEDYTKDKIAKLLEEQTQSTVSKTAIAIKEASALILVFKGKEEDDNYQLVGDLLSIGAAIQNILLRATDLGLGSLWIREITKISKEVCLLTNHQDLELVCAVTLGYPNEFPSARPRKELKEIVEYYDEG